VGLLFRGRPRRGAEALLPLLRSPLELARQYAAQTLSMLAASDTERHADDLAALLSADDPFLVAGALEGLALGLSGTAHGPAVEVLVQHGKEYPSAEVRKSAFRAVGYLCRRAADPPPQALDFLRWGCSPEQDLGVRDADARKEIRRGAIEGIGIALQGTGAELGFSCLRPFVQGNDYHLKAEAAFSLGQLCFATANQEAMKLLAGALEDREPHARWNIGLGMGLAYHGTGDETLFEWQEPALTDRDLDVRYYSSLGTSLAFHCHLSRLAEYFVPAPNRQAGTVPPSPRSVANLDGFLPLRPTRDVSLSGLGAFLQSYSAWYALPFYGYKHFSAEPFLCTERDHWQDLFDALVLVTTHRLEPVVQAIGGAAFGSIAAAFRLLRDIGRAHDFPAAEIEAYTAFWQAVDGCLSVSRPDEMRGVVRTLEEAVHRAERSELLRVLSPALKSFIPLASAIGSEVAGRQTGGEGLRPLLEEAAARSRRFAFLGFEVALTAVLGYWLGADPRKSGIVAGQAEISGTG